MSEFLRKVQMTEYGILKDLDRVCKANDITYFIAQGTLLGAAKYKGFIPWDDDVDVIIPYNDLKKLMSTYPSQGNEKYFYTSFNVEKYFPLPWSKIRAKDTLSRPVRYKDLPINWGICIDLFPVFSMSNNGLVRKAERFLIKIAFKLLMTKMTKYEEGHGMVNRLFEKIPIKLKHLYCNALFNHLASNKNDSRYVLIASKGCKIVERHLVFGEQAELPFEDGVFPVPSRYHEYLTEFYGDYMAPLPESEQRGHDMFMGEIEWKLPE